MFVHWLFHTDVIHTRNLAYLLFRCNKNSKQNDNRKIIIHVALLTF